MRKRFFPLLILFLLPLVSAELVKETTFSDLGYKSFAFQEQGKEVCTYYDFEIEDAFNNAKYYAVFSLKAKSFPENKGFTLTVYFNRAKEGIELTRNDFLGGVKKILLPQEQKKNKNNLKVCGIATEEVNKIEISEESSISIQKLPDLSPKGAFTQTPLNAMPKLGEEFEILVEARNYGSEKVNAKIDYRKFDLQERLPEIQVVGGETSAEKEISACQEYTEDLSECIEPGKIELRYSVRSTAHTKMTLLPAVLEYELLGEKKKMESNRPNITVIPKEIKLKPYILLEKEMAAVEEKIKGKIAVKNEGLETLYNLYLSLGLNGEGKDENPKWIKEIKPKETKYVEFEVKPQKEGENIVWCEVVYREEGVSYTNSCENLSLQVGGKMAAPIVIAIVFIVIGILVYAYIHLG